MKRLIILTIVVGICQIGFSQVNQYTKTQPQEFINTYTPIPFDEMMQTIDVISRTNAERIQYLDGLLEYILNIRSQPNIDAQLQNDMTSIYTKLKTYYDKSLVEYSVFLEVKKLGIEAKEKVAAYNQRINQTITRVQKTDVLSAEEYFTKGSNAHENGKYELAIENYQKALAIDPNNIVTYVNMGIAYMGLSDRNEAIRCYQKALAINPNYAEAFNHMGNAYAILTKQEEAIQCWQKAAKLGNSSARTWLQHLGHSW
jgi:tetratricopeptide (TPR) repeat protein